MILDTLDQADRYLALHPGFDAAFRFLRQPGLDQLAPGRHLIQDEQLFAIVSRGPGRTRQEAKLECHRRYIDIQFVIEGSDEMGWRPTASCRQPRAGYDPQKDIRFFEDEPETWVTARRGAYCIFFPEDAHAPLVSTALIHKVVVKIAV